MTVTVQTNADRTIALLGRWTVDPCRSAISFTAKLLSGASVTGSFREFEGSLEVDRDGDVRAHGTIIVGSLDTSVLERDRQLLSRDFFDVDRYPDIQYRLLAFRPTGHTGYRTLGELGIRGVTREVVLDGSIQGPVRGSWGEERLTLDLGGRLVVRDHGLGQNELVDGSPVAAETVRLAVDLSLVRRGAWA